jgi:lactate permease
LKYPFLTIASVVGFAFITNNSGMSNTMAMALASTGVMFPFFSPVLGWLGVFLTGSDTSSNALFCRLQYTSAEAIGVDPVITVSANASGGVTGKMISPQSIAIGTAAVGLVGKESELFRFTVKHSFIMLLVVCLLTVMQAYLFTWIVPAYELVLATAAATSDITRGFLYLLILAIAIAGIALTVFLLNRKKPKLPVPTAR